MKKLSLLVLVGALVSCGGEDNPVEEARFEGTVKVDGRTMEIRTGCATNQCNTMVTDRSSCQDWVDSASGTIRTVCDQYGPYACAMTALEARAYGDAKIKVCPRTPAFSSNNVALVGYKSVIRVRGSKLPKKYGMKIRRAGRVETEVAADESDEIVITQEGGDSDSMKFGMRGAKVDDPEADLRIEAPQAVLDRIE